MAKITRITYRFHTCRHDILKALRFAGCRRLYTSKALPHQFQNDTSDHYHIHEWETQFHPQEKKFDWTKLCDPRNTEAFRAYISHRKCDGNIDKVISLKNLYDAEMDREKKDEIWKQLIGEASRLSNVSHANSPVGDELCAEVHGVFGTKRTFSFKPKSHERLGDSLGVLRTDNVNLTTGPRTYYFIGDLARLEWALIQYSVKKLLKHKFTLMSVPELIYPEIIESCGFPILTERDQVYKIYTKTGTSCLAGTAEMPLAGFFSGKIIDQSQLPLTVAATSRCYRAETSALQEESGIYRVHHFTKVEMFGITSSCTAEESDTLLKRFVEIQKEMFSELGLYFRVINMPTEELGKPAFQKIDIEAWMPDKQFWGEISSSSSCTDFQSRHLNIQYRNENGDRDIPHTINGTAIAVPRMIMAILENNQQEDGSVSLPEVLWPYMKGVRTLLKQRNAKTSGFKWIKAIKLEK